MSKGDSQKIISEERFMKGRKGKIVFISVVITLVVASVLFILGGAKKEEKKENVGDIICERIKSEIPVSDIKISNNGNLFDIEAMTEKEKIFLFLEEKLGETGKKLRLFSSLLPDEIRFRCKVSLRTVDESRVKPIIEHMSLNEYEIPSSVLENIVDFPLISVEF